MGFKGDPSKFALGQKYKKKDPWTPKRVDNVDNVAAELKQSAKEAGIDSCEGEMQWEGEEIRMTKLNCKPWKFKEGEIASIITLYDPVRRPYTNLRQHFIFRGDWFPDDPSIADRRPDLLMQNTKFCGEDPDRCLDHLSLGMKAYIVLVNFGWMPENFATKEFLGWFILVSLLVLMSYASLHALQWLRHRFEKLPMMEHYTIPKSPKYAELGQIDTDCEQHHLAQV